jgi:hypothetical protein
MKREKYPQHAGPFLAYSDPDAKLEPTAYPEDLELVIAEYNAAPATLYGPRYFTATFDEYMAQSYARYVAGDRIPKYTKAFIEKAVGADR